MSCDRYSPQLDGLVDGTLSDADQRAVQQHLATCDTCADELAGVQSLVSLASRLDGLAGPSRFADLGLSRSDRPLTVSVAPSRGYSLRQLGVVATFCVALGAAGAWIGSGAGENVEKADPSLRQMTAAISALEATWPQTSTLDAETLAQVQQTLRIVDAAIAEIEAARADHPDDSYLKAALVRAYGQKIDVLSQLALST